MRKKGRTARSSCKAEVASSSTYVGGLAGVGAMHDPMRGAEWGVKNGWGFQSGDDLYSMRTSKLRWHGRCEGNRRVVEGIVSDLAAVKVIRWM